MDIIDVVLVAEASALLIGCVLTVGFMLGSLLDRRARDFQHRPADNKAKTLLKQWLSTEQLTLFERNVYFEVKGSHTGKRYRIRCARQMNIDELDANGALVGHWCFAPAGCLPLGDIISPKRLRSKPTNVARLPSQIVTQQLD